MAVGVEIATAYVSIVPSFRGIKANLTNGLKKAMGVTAADLEAPLVKGARSAAKKASEAASKEFEFGMRSGTAKVVNSVESALKRVTGITRQEKFFDPAIAQRDLNTLQIGLNNFGRKTTAGFQAVGSSISNAFKSFTLSSAQTDTWGQRLFAAIGRADDAVMRFGSTVVGKIDSGIGGAFSRLNKKLGETAGLSEATASKFSKFATSAAGSVAMTATSVAALSVAGTVAAGAIAGVGLAIAGINRLSTIQQSTVAFEVMLGSAEKAKAVMAELTTFAKTTPFPLDAITEAAKTLKAMGQDTEKLVPTLKAAGDAAAALGTGTQGMKDISFIMGQIITKGKLEGDELVQLAERGVNASQILGNKLGVAASDAGAKIKDLGISAKSAVGMIVDGIENGTEGINGSTAKMGGMLERFKQTWEGRWTDMKAAFSRLGATIFAPLFEGGQTTMAALTKLMDNAGAAWKKMVAEFKSSGAASALKAFGSALAGVAKALVPVAAGSRNLSDKFFPAIRDVLNWLTPLLKDLAKWLEKNDWFVRLLGWALIGLVIALTLLAGAVIVAMALLGAMSAVAFAVFGAISWAIYHGFSWLINEAPGLIGQAFFFIFEQAWIMLKDIWKIFVDFGNLVVDLFITLGEFIVAVWSTLTETLIAIFMSFWYFITGQWSSLGDVWANFGSRMGAIWGGVWEGIKAVGRDAINVIIGMINGAIHQVNGLIEAINSIPGVNIGGTFGDIPRFASGGIVTGPTLGVFGEAGDEAVFPLDDLENFIQTNNTSNSGPTQVVINAAGADRQFLTFLRALVRTQGGGNVQKAFGV